MVKEIYIRTPNDPNYEEGVIEYSNEVESAISQIRMILETHNGEVLGAYNFGIDLDYLVFNTIRDSFSIEKEIQEQLSLYAHISKNLSVDVKVNFGNSNEGYDYAVVDVYLNGVKSVGFVVDKN